MLERVAIKVEAVAKARELPVSDVRRALMLAGDLASVARGDLTDLAIQLFRPIKPMLAKTGTLEDVGPAALEYKLDGIRIQVHKRAAEVRHHRAITLRRGHINET